MSRILIVEDDDKQRAMIGMILANAGYKITEAVSVATALMHLDLLDLCAVVLDVRLPNGHGRKVVEALIAKRDDVPVVVLTGYPEDAPTGFPVTAVIDKMADRRDSSSKATTFRTRLLDAISAARRTSDDIRSIRTSTRKLGDMLDAN